MKPIYVDSADPVDEVEDFIAKFKVDDNFRPLARLLRRFSRNLVSDTALDVTVPDAFTSSNVSLDETDGSVTATISSLPDNGGAAIARIEYRVDDAEAYTSVAVGSLPMIIPLAEDAESGAEIALTIRAVNTIGPSDPYTTSVTVE